MLPLQVFADVEMQLSESEVAMCKVTHCGIPTGNYLQGKLEKAYLRVCTNIKLQEMSFYVQVV